MTNSSVPEDHNASLSSALPQVLLSSCSWAFILYTTLCVAASSGAAVLPTYKPQGMSRTGSCWRSALSRSSVVWRNGESCHRRSGRVDARGTNAENSDGCGTGCRRDSFSPLMTAVLPRMLSFTSTGISTEMSRPSIDEFDEACMKTINVRVAGVVLHFYPYTLFFYGLLEFIAVTTVTAASNQSFGHFKPPFLKRVSHTSCVFPFPRHFCALSVCSSLRYVVVARSTYVVFCVYDQWWT